jgi:tRNA(Ile)-lysidine synthase
MASSRVTLRPLWASATARAIVRAWRELTGGSGVRDPERRTLVACSGGADSSALLLALGTRPGNVVAAHVVHDLRPRREALRDAARVRGLARALGVAYVQAEVRVRGVAGNAEANARAARYAALVRLARAHGCRYVCTAHHADDLAETVLMRLLRGSGPRGLAGMRGTRGLADGVTLVRPMLGVTRMQGEALCTRAGWSWSEDATNRDTTRLRAALRARVLPVLAEIAPGYQARVARSAGLLDACARLLRGRARRLLPANHATGGTCELDRARVRRTPEIVAGEAVRLAHTRVGGGTGADRVSQRVLAQVVRAARDGVGGTRVFSVGGVRIEVTRERVTLRAIGRDRAATRGGSAGRPRRRSRASGSAGAGSTRRTPSGRARAGASAAGAGTAGRTRRPSRSR